MGKGPVQDVPPPPPCPQPTKSSHQLCLPSPWHSTHKERAGRAPWCDHRSRHTPAPSTPALVRAQHPGSRRAVGAGETPPEHQLHRQGWGHGTLLAWRCCGSPETPSPCSAFTYVKVQFKQLCYRILTPDHKHAPCLAVLGSWISTAVGCTVIHKRPSPEGPFLPPARQQLRDQESNTPQHIITASHVTRCQPRPSLLTLLAGSRPSAPRPQAKGRPPGNTCLCQGSSPNLDITHNLHDK